MSTTSVLEGSPQSRRDPLVLVVDDEQVTRMLARESLEEAGFLVNEAEDGVNALTSFENLDPDLVLLDVKMPRMDGFRACAELRRSNAGRHTPIMMMTGLEDVRSIERAYEVGATDFVNKPINWLVLGHRLEYMLRNSRTADRLRDSQRKLANAQRIAGLGYWEWHLGGREVYCSDELRRILDLGADEPVTGLALLLRRVHRDDRALVRNVMTELMNGRPVDACEFRVLGSGGEDRMVRQQVEVLRAESGRPLRLTGAVQDVTERHEARARIHFLSHYDGLTGLPNRRSLFERLTPAISSAAARQGQLAVLFLDIDRFARVNETYGHSSGDLILQEVADRITGCVRANDFVGRPLESRQPTLVSRFGGDEFAVLLPEIQDIESAAAVARRLTEEVGRPYRLQGQDLFLTSSIGISLYPHDGRDAQGLLKHADTAMCVAKGRQGNSCEYYTAAMTASALAEMTVENGLRQALDRGEFELFYQPQYDVRRGAITGAEALIRWRHPELGLVLPSRFIPLAEDSGQIGDIGRWVIREACRQSVAWQRATGRSLRMGVNVSNHQFADPGFLDEIKYALAETGAEPSMLDIELTESVLLREGDGSVAVIEGLKRLGVGISIDDFGTGYSSLSYLTRLPVDALKIDRSFIVGLPGRSEHAAIVRAIVAMAHSLGLRVIGEGIEQEEQLAFLKSVGCDEMQGFLASRPLEAGRVAKLLDAAARLSA